MKRAFIAIMTCLGVALCLWAQTSGTTTLQVRVDPEQHIAPSRADLTFYVSADGSADVLTRTQTVASWVRSLPGETIRVLAGVSGLPPEAELRWTSAAVGATGGGQSASCTKGTFDGAVKDLVASWTRSGTLTCSVTFELANPRALPPGPYTATVAFSLAR